MGIDVKEAKRLVDDHVPEIIKKKAESAAKKKAEKDAERAVVDGKKEKEKERKRGVEEEPKQEALKQPATATEKTLSSFWLKELWQKTRDDTPVPDWISKGDRFRLSEARELWQAETDKQLPEEVAARAY